MITTILYHYFYGRYFHPKKIIVENSSHKASYAMSTNTISIDNDLIDIEIDNTSFDIISTLKQLTVDMRTQSLAITVTYE